MSRQLTYRRRLLGPSENRPAGRCGGFTMVELLVTVTIIAILATVVLASLQAARESAREVKTRMTIVKLDRIVMARYESYRARRVPINTSGMHPGTAAKLRRRALRELVRMEMPERWTDIVFPSADLDPDVFNLSDQDQPILITEDAVTVSLQRPSLARAYFRRLVQRRAQLQSVPVPSGETDVDKWLDHHFPAECLYMIVTFGSSDAREQFKDNEVGDADGDGLLEFHDGWDRPIYFLRWAPGFPDSDVQTRDPVADHDPFDPRNLESGAWRLVPLIYSGGPDRRFGLNSVADIPDSNPPVQYAFQKHYSLLYDDPSTPALDPIPIGAPVDSTHPNYETHYDNIHNHRIEAD